MEKCDGAGAGAGAEQTLWLDGADTVLTLASSAFSTLRGGRRKPKVVMKKEGPPPPPVPADKKTVSFDQLMDSAKKLNLRVGLTY